MNDTASVAELIQAQSDEQVYLYITVSAMVLVTYDVFLTMDREVNFIWKRGLRFGTIAYILARYATPLSMILDIMYTFLPPSPITGLIQNCAEVLGFYNAFNVLSGIGSDSLLLARVYAICHRHRWLVILPFALFLGRTAINFTDSFLLTCTSASPIIPKIVTAGDVFVIGFDLSIVTLTVGHTWRVYRDKDAYRDTIMGLILKQGILRFIIIFVWGLEIIIVKQLVRPTIGGVDVFLEAAVSVILICRFHLDLSARNLHSEQETTEPAPASTLSFQAAVRRFDTHIDTDFGDNDGNLELPTQGDVIELGNFTSTKDSASQKKILKSDVFKSSPNIVNGDVHDA